jgi:hypothetical protein
MTRCLMIVAVVAVASPASADEITVKSYLTGGFSADGTYANSPAFQNYRVGHSPVTTVAERRNFFLFDLTTLPPMPPGAILGGSLKLYVPHFAPGVTIDPGDGYISPDPFEIYRLSATPFTPDEIAAPVHTPASALAIYATLGMAPLAGEVAVSPADLGTFLDIPLTPGAIFAINSGMGSMKIALGGRLTTLSFIPPDELVFGFTDLIGPHMKGKEPKLVLTIIPAPGAAGVLGWAGVVACRRRRIR